MKSDVLVATDAQPNEVERPASVGAGATFVDPAEPIFPKGLHRFAVVTSTLVIFAGHIMTLGYKKFANVDEAYALALGRRLLDGKHLYEGAVSQRGPLMYYFFEFVARVGGWDNILGIRLWALLFSLGQGAAAYCAARYLVSDDAAVLALVTTAYALTFGFPAFDGLALNGETLLAPILIAAASLGAFALVHRSAGRRRSLLLISGAGIGIAGCIKQTVVPQLFPLLVWIIVDGIRHSHLRRSAVDALATVGAFLALPLVFIAHAWHEGTLRQFVYYVFTYNLSIHARVNGSPSRFARFVEPMVPLPLFFTLLAVGIAISVVAWWPIIRTLFRFRSLDTLVSDFGLRHYLALQFAISLLVAVGVPQLFPHYFLVPVPFLTLLVVEYLTAEMAGPWLRPLTVGAVVMWTVGAVGLVYFREKDDGRVAHDIAPEKAARFIERTTSPSDSIFVWGFSPWLYEYSHRTPASRFVFATYATGFVPWFWEQYFDEWKTTVPGALDALLGDLDAEQPELVVDAGSVMIARTMRAYPKASEWLHAHYCFEARVAAYDIYRKKRGGCPVDWFPYPAPNVDYFGRPLVVLSPYPVDFPESRPLPPGDYLLPLRFVPHVCAAEPIETFYRPREQLMCTFGLERLDDSVDPLGPTCTGPCPGAAE